MASSTTQTTEHVLLKYSRAYSASSGIEQPWQHFANPTIRLILDVKKAAQSGELESVRLRISWSMTQGEEFVELDQSTVFFVCSLVNI
jgi:hypothetical protein